MNSDGSQREQFAAQFNSPSITGGPDPDRSDRLPSAFLLFRPSSRLVNKSLLKFIIIVFLPGVYLGFLEQIFKSKTANQHTALWVALIIIGLAYNLSVFAAKPVLELLSVHGKQLGLGAVFKLGWRYFLRVLGLYIVVAAVIFIGIICFIVPGIIMIRRYTLAVYFLVDQDVSIFESMRRSAAVTKGHSGAVWGLIGVQLLLSIPGWIPFIGVFISGGLNMVYTCAPALRYEQFMSLDAQTATKPKKDPKAAQPGAGKK